MIYCPIPVTISRSRLTSGPPLSASLLYFSEHFSALTKALSASPSLSHPGQGSIYCIYYIMSTTGCKNKKSILIKPLLDYTFTELLLLKRILIQLSQSLSNNAVSRWKLVNRLHVCMVMWRCHVTTRGEENVTPLSGMHECLLMQVHQLLVGLCQLYVGLSKHPVRITVDYPSEGSASDPVIYGHIWILIKVDK